MDTNTTQIPELSSSISPRITTITDHDPVTLARIYKIAFLTLQDPVFKLLMTPLQHTHEHLDVSYPLSFPWPQDHPELDWKRLEAELTLFWIRMWDTWGLVPWNFFLLLQPDGRVALTNMEDFGFLHWNDPMGTGKRTTFWIAMPRTINPKFFFSLSSFPDGFYERVKDTEGVSPVFSPLDVDVN
jgi:hypothetical protein